MTAVTLLNRSCCLACTTGLRIKDWCETMLREEGRQIALKKEGRLKLIRYKVIGKND